MQKILFVDRDGTLVLEPEDYQINSLDKVIFYPEVFQYLSRIAKELDFELVLVTNQDGLGTDSFPEEGFWPAHDFIMKSFANEGVYFSQVFIDKSFRQEQKPTRKPGIGMLLSYINNEDYDLAHSFVIGDRITDVQLAYNLGAKAIFIANDELLGAHEIDHKERLDTTIALKTTSWKAIYDFLKHLPA
ncbi:histidinol-phosphatase [Taibaiella sp. KBW10]|uniref:histidinol-phosphatase n=1 Tax=Taibaiella sp. KBW10 TaxID=2153357 RepID=UPI000F595F6C|nr:histidinol-phosphatase [Taibaiella sp. KBW10]RQO31632.1 histidinol-phosphatase [Taibaiella sp. KBW10]